MLNLAKNRPAYQSSICSWSKYKNNEQDAAIANSGVVDLNLSCHTNTEFQPWWQVELDAVYDVERVVIYNRLGNRERLKNFSLLRSLDGQHWFEYFRKRDDTVFEIYTASIIEPRPTRFIRLRLDGTNCLHISACEIFGKPSDAKTIHEMRFKDEAAISSQHILPKGQNGHLTKIGAFNVFVNDEYGEAIKRALESGNYEARERYMVGKFLKPTDRVLEVGTAAGVVTMTSASMVGAKNVVTFEANPAMVEAARDNFARNGFAEISANHGILTNKSRFLDGQKVPFHVSRNFWASRLDVGTKDGDIIKIVDVPMICLEDEISKNNINVIICDIEGGEVDLFTGADLSGIRLIIMETHYWAMGESAVDSMVRYLILQGFAIHLGESRGEVVVLRRSI